MKKRVFIAVALTLVFALSGCGGSSDPGADASNAASTSEDTTASMTSKISEQVLVEQDGIRIIAKECELSLGESDPEIPILVENNSDKNISVKCDNFSCNGIMTEPSLYCEVPAGKKMNETISLSAQSLSSCGIETIGILEFRLVLMDDTYQDLFTTEPIVIETSNAQTYKATMIAPPEGTVLLDESGFKITYLGKVDYSDYGSDIVFYLKNSSSEGALFSHSELSVNGFVLDTMDYPYSGMFSFVTPGKVAYSGFSLTDSDMEANGITNIEDIEVTLVVEDNDTFDDLATTGPISIPLK